MNIRLEKLCKMYPKQLVTIAMLGILMTGCMDAGYAETPVTEETEAGAELTFFDLSKRKFGFCGGNGGWVEEFTIERDGFFMGKFVDSDMGSRGEDYAHGTQYVSSYTGHFTDLQKRDAYSYTMRLADISYKKEVDTEEIKMDVRYLYTNSYCLGENSVFTIYLPGTPLDTFSDDVRYWINYYNESETELTMIVIVEEENQYGMYSVERLSPHEDAKVAYEDCRNTYERYLELLQNAYTTLEMHQNANARYEVSDECLNYIWNLIRYNVPEEEYQQILAEQREWLKERDARAAAAAAEWEQGSFEPVAYVEEAASATLERCEALVDYLK